MDLLIFLTNIITNLFWVLIYLAVGIWISRKLKLSWNSVLWILASFMAVSVAVRFVYFVVDFFTASYITSEFYLSLPFLLLLSIFFGVFTESSRYVSFKYIFKKLGIKPGKKSAVSSGSLWWAAIGMLGIVGWIVIFTNMAFPHSLSNILGFSAEDSSLNLVDSNAIGYQSESYEAILNEAFKFDIVQILGSFPINFMRLAVEIGFSLLVVASFAKGRKHLLIAAMAIHSLISLFFNFPDSIYATAAIYASYLAITVVVLINISDLWKKGAVELKEKFLRILEKWYE
jgi:uncharacterized membrane protein YhfC